MYLIKYKLGTHIIGHSHMTCIGFGECSFYSFLQGYKKEFLYITAYGRNLFKVL